MSQKTFRVLICEFHQETNTFNPLISTLDHFKAIRYLEGEAFFDACRGISCAVQGMLDAVEEAGGLAIPTIDLFAQSGGRVDRAVYDLLMERMRHYCQTAGDFDAVFASLHGATCLQDDDDACGLFLEELRALVGEEKIIAASFDLHANITGRSLASADVICGYQTYPHMDFYETGYRAARLGIRKLKKQETHVASTLIPMMVSPAGYTTLQAPFKDIMARGKALVEAGDLLDYTLFQVQPWLDIGGIATCVIAVGEDPRLAEACAQELGRLLFDHREAFWPRLQSIDSVLDRAEEPQVDKPVILVDFADSPNGGAVGDSVAVALRIHERGSKVKAGMFVKDPQAAEQAFELGVGGSAEFSIGAKYTPNMPGPLVVTATIRSLHDGVFIQEGPAGRGIVNKIGKTAVLSTGNMDIMVCQEPAASGDPQLLRHFGIEPTLYDLVVVKANSSYIVPYGAFAGEIYVADTPGACAADLSWFDWQHLPAPMYPFDPLEGYQVEAAEIRRK